MLPRLSELFGKQRLPSGYRPGATLEQVRRNLAGLSFEALDGGARGRFGVPGCELEFEVVERTQSELLMHLVLTDFVLHVPAPAAAVLRVELRHSGALTRSGLACKRRQGDAAELAALERCLLGDEALRQVLMPLDFKRLSIERQAAGWQVRLEHMAASEVVNRMPNFRRYIRLNDEQRDCLINAFIILQRLLRTC